MFCQAIHRSVLNCSLRRNIRVIPKFLLAAYGRRSIHVQGQPLPIIDGFESSEELEKAFHALSAGKNLTFNAVAGAGKTTSIVYLMKLLKHIHPSEDFRVLFLAFNRIIKDETKKKMEEQSLQDNIEVHTYHSAGVSLYSDDGCGTDQGLKRLVERHTPPTKELFGNEARHILVLDELQDMAPPLYNFVRKLISDIKKQTRGEIQKICLGDPRQSIYAYKDADSRFLTLASRIYGTEDNEAEKESWHTVQVTASHRLSHAITGFINNQFIKKTTNREFIVPVGHKTGPEYPKPIYITCNAKQAYSIIKEHIPDIGDNPEETVILSPSLKIPFVPIKPLMNTFAKNKYPVFIGTEDAVDRTDRTSRGKIRALTLHQAKGLTAKNVVLMGFDSDYKYFARTEYGQEGAHLPPIYVALTRPTHKLLLIHHYKNDYLPFIDKATLGGDCEIVSKKVPEKKVTNLKSKAGTRRQVTPVTKLLSHLSERIESVCFQDITLEKREKSDPILPQWPHKEVSTGKVTSESVNALTATALVGFAELRQTGSLKMLKNTASQIKAIKTEKEKGKYPSFVSDRLLLHESGIEAMCKCVEQGRELSPRDMLRLAILRNMVFSGYINKDITLTSQRCKWLDPQFIDEAVKWILFYVPPGSEWEVVYNANVDGFPVRGVVDAVTPNGEIYEFKYGRLTPSDVLQVCCYAALAKKSHGYLLEYVSGRLVKIEERYPGAFAKLLSKLVEAKYAPSKIDQLSMLNDDQFVKEARAGFPKFVTKCTIPDWL